ncbi:MAG: SDR family oxidoreductase [Desulfosudaceae bacterium]
MDNFRDKNCLITGAASGIGRATAIAAGKLGARLFLTDINDEMLAETVRLVEAEGGRVSFHRALDIADYEAVAEMAGVIHESSGSMDIIMNIAGISVWGEIDRLTYRHWEKTINIDLWGPVHTIICFLSEMIASGRGGHLVNVASAAGLVALPWHSPYSAAKFGLVGVSEVLRYDLIKHHINVSVVCPGAVETPLKQTVDIVGVDRDHPEVKKLEAMFSRRAVSPEKVAGQIVKAIRRKRFLVFTSTDIRLLYWLKRKHHWAYHLIMKQVQKLIVRAMARASQG